MLMEEACYLMSIDDNLKINKENAYLYVLDGNVKAEKFYLK